MGVEDFVLDLDAILRISGIAGDIDDDANTIEAKLTSAREKYGIHFESDEAIVLHDEDGSYCGSSMLINNSREISFTKRNAQKFWKIKSICITN